MFMVSCNKFFGKCAPILINLLLLALICQSYRKNNSSTLLMAHRIHFSGDLTSHTALMVLRDETFDVSLQHSLIMAHFLWPDEVGECLEVIFEPRAMMSYTQQRIHYIYKLKFNVTFKSYKVT